MEALKGDLARTHRRSPTGGAAVPSSVVDADLAVLERDGAVVLEDLLGPDELAAVRAGVEGLLGPTGRNTFEGRLTQRAYSLLDRTRACDRLLDHPRVLALLDRLLLPNYLLSQLQAIKILPGEDAQMLHFDDGFYPLPRPRPALGAATIWAIDPFTAENGATVTIPGSHLWGEGRLPGPADEHVPTVMRAGSCVFFLGTLWHGGGPNRSAAARLALTAQYCQPWLRTQEAFTLSTSRETARAVSPDIQRMLGYSIFPPFAGAVAGMHPLRLLHGDR
jgi:hypothetical protein